MGGRGWAAVFTFAEPSEIHKKEHGRKDIKVTKKTLKIKDIETLEICCVNTTIMLDRKCAQEVSIDHLRP
jgi:hypothetical protein